MARIYVDVNYAVMIIPCAMSIAEFLERTYVGEVITDGAPKVGDLRIVDREVLNKFKTVVQICTSEATPDGWVLSGNPAAFEDLGYVQEFKSSKPPTTEARCTNCEKYERLYLNLKHGVSQPNKKARS